MQPRNPEFVLTIVQHTYCTDCMWIKSKITDVYHASGIVRGDDSKHWRMNIISPNWDRELRKPEFPIGFETIDVPALKLEVNKKIIFATQDPALISELLSRLKWMLINRNANDEIAQQLAQIVQDWDRLPIEARNNQAVCITQ
ncbi:MAG: hypothetical protein AB1757_12210 [Acidobacteriota bacterium]